MKINKSELKINTGCEGCQKDCKWRGLTTADDTTKNKYKCNGV